MLQAYDSQLWSTLESSLLIPLCRHIESDLRLHHHAALLTGVPPINPNSSEVLNMTPLLDVPALQLSTSVVDIRYGVLMQSVMLFAALIWCGKTSCGIFQLLNMHAEMDWSRGLTL